MTVCFEIVTCYSFVVKKKLESVWFMKIDSMQYTVIKDADRTALPGNAGQCL